MNQSFAWLGNEYWRSWTNKGTLGHLLGIRFRKNNFHFHLYQKAVHLLF